MKHYGDITKLSGYTLPTVDVITGGSPCQDLSVAGKRAGLEGERSGLFMEQIRIIREMRERDKKENGRSNQFIRPRFAVWENVPGAFSSNGGRDFQAVLTEFARIAEPDAPDVPMPDNGKWPHSGCIYQKMGGWSIAWRVHDAQFWGVPQRRKRISLVADFGGLSAPEISFERKGLSGDPAEGGAERERAPAHAGCGIENTGLRVYGIGGFNSEGMLSPNPRAEIYEADTAAVDCRNGTANPDVNGTLQAKEGQNLNSNNVVLIYPEVRRLTPLECTRLQGFPDSWVDIGDWVDSNGKTHKAADSPQYKALGNSIALPYWFWLLRRISAQYERPATLGSLFDGIGGFPLCWERCNGPGTAIWASEIEEFAIAVTKKHFPEDKP